MVSLSYTLSDASITQISAQVLATMEGPINRCNCSTGKSSYRGAIPDATLKAMIEPIVIQRLTDALPSAIKSRFANIPVYQYTGKNTSGDN